MTESGRTSRRPTDDELALVARHGSGPVVRALATVELARRQGRLDELRAHLGETASKQSEEAGHAEISRSDAGALLRPDGGSAAGPADPPRPLPDPDGPTIVNVVVSGSVGREFDVRAIGADIDAGVVDYDDGDYDRECVYIYRSEDSPLLTVYPSGKFHTTGSRTVAKAQRLVGWFRRELGRMGIAPAYFTFAVENVVATGDIGRALDLAALWKRLGHQHAEYDPEQANKALAYRPDAVDPVYQIHSTGSVIIFGGSVAAVFRGFDWLRGRI